MMDAVSRCALDLSRAREAFSSSSQPSANGHDTSPPEQPLADRYYELAETMNARGAMELAVPFYRQAVALLLEERQQLRQLLPDGVPQPPMTRAAPALSDAAVEGLLAESSPSTAETLEARLAELAEELTPTSAQQVLVGVDALLRWSGASVLPAAGFNLRGKAHVLLGDSAAAVSAFAAARDADPDELSYDLNLAAALVMAGKAAEALALLQPLHEGGLTALPAPLREPLLRNLASAEQQAGRRSAALERRREWLALNPEAVPLQRWLAWAGLGLAADADAASQREALVFLEDLLRHWPDERSIKEVLAQALEARGDYRRAALLYRDLLRP